MRVLVLELFLCLVGCLHLAFIKADEILGCGGFIKSQGEIDFSKVEIKLLTKGGSLKDKTDCSPSNGYYFLPVYDKGEYTLKISPPHGWSFDPESIEINFDGKTDPCSKGKDVNFFFTGFGITGKVAIAGNLGGARGVNVQLRSENKGGSDVRKTTTDINGVFSFTPVIPGKYIVKATSHNRWHFSKAEHSVVVHTGNTVLPENCLVVAGFDVQGKIVSNGQTLHNVGIALFKEKGQTLSSSCDKSNLPQIKSGSPNFDASPICFTATDKNGDFLLKAVAPGKYLVKPVILNKDLKLHIKPENLEFQVTKDTHILKDHFEVTGFSVTGRVLASPEGFGVGGATIKLNGQKVTTTHTDGSYSLENIKAGTYTVQVEADNLQFTDHTVKLSLLNPILPDIVVSAFKVCGLVMSERSHLVGITKQGSTFHTTATSSPGATGEWCSFLPNGRYTIEVLITDADKANGIQFFPLVQTAEVKSSPLSGIVFSQLRATVKGEIMCLGDSSSSCKNIEVTLHALDSSGKHSVQTTVTAQHGQYTFTDVLPGNYELTIPQSNLCWEKTKQELTVKTATEVVKPFIHTGYEISVIASHKTKMQYSMRTTKKDIPKTTEVELMSGVDSFCVPQAGEYTMELIDCHLYDTSLPKIFSTNDINPLLINAISHKIGIRILTPEQPKDAFKMLLAGKPGKMIVTLIAEANKIDGYFSYRYDTYIQPEEVISLTPQSSIMLFKPQTKEVIGGNECVNVMFTFMATRGLIIEGKVLPPIKDAKITLTYPKNPELQALEAMTTAAGSFKFGPLDGSLQIELKAEKESYVFSDYDKLQKIFKAHKLCEIIATVKDDMENKLSGVLLSLSGAESYRKNLVTGDDGTIKFHSLSPSEYYLRPMMKEYKFNPASKMIEVKDGETIQVELIGKRVAFSVFGTITSLNGDPFANVIVEAISDEKCMHHQEESTSENNGQYRIRGLQPDCKYTVRPKAGETNPNVERSIPEFRLIYVAKNDIKKIDLTAISPYGFVDVIARVYASSNDHYKGLRIQMYKKGNPDSPIYSQRVESPLNPKLRFNPGIMVFFPRIPLDGKTYFVELKTSISDKIYKYQLPVAQFIANTSSVYVELNFNTEIKTGEGDLNQNSISALILIALVAIVFFKQDLAMDFLNFVWGRVSGIVQDAMDRQSKKKETRYVETINYKEIEQMAEGINSLKKKKPKKI